MQPFWKRRIFFLWFSK